jgi:dTMP kinase
VGRLIVVEGLDGAGKRTLTDALCAALAGRGAPVERVEHGHAVHRVG